MAHLITYYTICPDSLRDLSSYNEDPLGGWVALPGRFRHVNKSRNVGAGEENQKTFNERKGTSSCIQRGEAVKIRQSVLASCLRQNPSSVRGNTLKAISEE